MKAIIVFSGVAEMILSDVFVGYAMRIVGANYCERKGNFL